MIKTMTTFIGLILTSIHLMGNSPRIELDSMLIEENGFYGYLYKPKNQDNLIPIIVLGGSDGGIRMKEITRSYAMEGFAALNVAYFDYKDLPKHLAKIPVEYFQKSIKWILSQDYVKSSSVVLHGFSRGAELALLLASEYPDISVAIAMSGSNLRWGGFGGFGEDRDPSADMKPAWIKDGVPMPYMKTEFDTVEYYKCKNNAEYVKRYLLDTIAVRRASIPIQRSNAAFLLISGRNDDIWPSKQMNQNAIKLLNSVNYKHNYQHLLINGVFHYFDLKSTIYADKTCWNIILDFINANYK
jgi:uncharacterized protein